MTETKARQRLFDYTQKYGSNAEAARALGISRQMLHDVLNNRRGVSDSIAAQIGLQRVSKTTVTYKEIA